MDDPTINVRKIANVVSVPFELLIEAGVMTEDEARASGWTPIVRPPVPRLRRLRWDLQAWWHDHGPRIHFGPCDHRDCA